jgi:transcription antitermination factor NusG
MLKKAETGSRVHVLEGPFKDAYFIVKERRSKTTVLIQINGKPCTFKDKDLRVVVKG